jgi:hypothetical protein
MTMPAGIIAMLAGITMLPDWAIMPLTGIITTIPPLPPGWCCIAVAMCGGIMIICGALPGATVC